MSTDFLSILAKDKPSKNYMKAQVPNRAPPKGKGTGKDKSKDDSASPVPEGLALHTPIFFPEDLYLQPEIPLYSPQQYWEDLVNRHFLPPDFRDHNKIRCAYNTDSIQHFCDGKIRHPTPKGQNPTHAGILDVSSILRTNPNCIGRNGGVLEHFYPFFQHSHSELVQLNTNDVYTHARFERWVVGPMVAMRYRNIPFNKDGNPCHYYKQPTMWPNPCHFANKGCQEGNNCRSTRCEQEAEFAERLLRTWGHEFPHEAGALIKVYREALREVNSINPNPQMLNISSRCRPDGKWLNMNPIPPETQPVQAATPGTIPGA